MESQAKILSRIEEGEDGSEGGGEGEVEGGVEGVVKGEDEGGVEGVVTGEVEGGVDKVVEDTAAMTSSVITASVVLSTWSSRGPTDSSHC